MNVNLQQAQEKRLQFEQMYSDGGVGTLSDQAQDKLTKMKAGCLYRRELDALGQDEAERRKILLDFIALENPHLWTLFET